MKHTPGHWNILGQDIFGNEENGYICTWSGNKANASLIAAAPDLLEEHIQWGKILGHILVMALQNDYEALDVYKKHIEIDYRDGEPFIKSQAISMAEKEE